MIKRWIESLLSKLFPLGPCGEVDRERIEALGGAEVALKLKLKEENKNG